MLKSFEPRRGAFAYCSRGELGLITSEMPLTVVYEKCFSCSTILTSECTCVTGIAWVGIHLSPEKFGEPWSSRTPRVVGALRPDTWMHGFIVDGRQSRAFLYL